MSAVDVDIVPCCSESDDWVVVESHDRCSIGPDSLDESTDKPKFTKFTSGEA